MNNKKQFIELENKIKKEFYNKYNKNIYLTIEELDTKEENNILIVAGSKVNDVIEKETTINYIKNNIDEIIEDINNFVFLGINMYELDDRYEY